MKKNCKYLLLLIVNFSTYTVLGVYRFFLDLLVSVNLVPHFRNKYIFIRVLISPERVLGFLIKLKNSFVKLKKNNNN